MPDLRSILSSSGGSLRPGGRMVIREQELKTFRLDVAFGVLSAAFALEADAKARTPVRGGFRSFQAGAHLGGPLGIEDVGTQTRYAKGTHVGGTLRRSIHSAAYLDGKKIGGPDVDENKVPVEDQPAGSIAAVVGTNVNYAGYVNDGTVKMAARPFMNEAMAALSSEVPALIAAGYRRRVDRRGGS